MCIFSCSVLGELVKRNYYEHIFSNIETPFHISFVLDIDPPTCNCPPDIFLDNITTPDYRVNWELPRCSDGSGISPTITVNRRPGDLFAVPGKYEVQLRIKGQSTVETKCLFTIELTSKSWQIL